MFRGLVWSAIVIAVIAFRADATIRYVSSTGAGSYTTIGAAASAAVTGDTILIGPGTFTMSGINEVNKRLIYIGAGWDQTIISIGSFSYVNGAGATRTSFEGMRLVGNGTFFTLANSPDSIAFRRCYFDHGSVSGKTIEAGSGRGMTFEDCIFLNNQTSTASPAIGITDSNYPTTLRNCVFVNRGASTSCRVLGGVSTSGTVELYNCAFLNFQTPLALNAAGGPVIAVNNLFYDWIGTPSFGTYNTGSSLWDYNASSSIAAPGGNTLAISTNPFVYYSESNNYEYGLTDLRLDPVNGASLIDSGNPGLLDFLDNTTSDRGVYGGPKPLVDNGVPNYPWAVNISLSPNLVGVGTPVTASAIGRVGPQY